MSRIGKQPIPIPDGVTVTVKAPVVTVQGPKGSLSCTLHRVASTTVADGVITVTVKDPDDAKQRALWGLSRNLIRNMVEGVQQGFSRQLEINGIGYKAAVGKGELVLNVGYSHPVSFRLPAGVEVVVEKNIITIRGIDKQVVGQVAAQIRAVRPPEPYKGKGIKYLEEVIVKKAGKAATKAAA